MMHSTFSIAGFAAICLATTALGQTSAPATQPVGISGRSQEAIFAEIESAHHRFNSVVTDPADISDPVRRKAIAPRAIEPLRTMVNDFHELAQMQPRMNRRAAQVELQFMAFLSVLGDQAATDQLQSMAISKDPVQSLRGQASQLLAKWVLAGKDETAESHYADEVRSLDQAHPDSEDLTFLTVTLSQSTPSASLEKQLMQLAVGMQNPVADKVRKATTKPQ